MTKRADYPAEEPAALQALFSFHKYVKGTGIEEKLLNLINLRASQINGCAFCLNMHNREARAAGETEQRLYTLSAWRETELFEPRERAVLALTECVTLISDKGVPD